MDTLSDRLAELADDAPTGGAPAAELWARGQRAHRLRTAAVAATLVLVGAVGTGLGVRLADSSDNGSDLASAGIDGVALPIEYPTEEDLPDLGNTPGPLVAIWLAPGAGGPPQAVGLVAETGMFGTLSLDVLSSPEGDPHGLLPALSPDGRMMAYDSSSGELIVHDLVSGEKHTWPANVVEKRAGHMWIDDTHLLGHTTAGGDSDGWVWEPGSEPQLVNPWTYAGSSYLGPYAGRDLLVIFDGGGPSACATRERADFVGGSPMLVATKGTDDQADDQQLDVPVLCDVLGVIGSEILLGHWNSDHLPGDWDDPDDGNETVVALDIHGADPPFDDPDIRRVVVSAGAPEFVSFATDLIGAALDADGGAS